MEVCQDLPCILSTVNTFTRGHLAADLAPYVCIMDNCQEDIMLVTTEDLNNHVRKEHGVERWVCDYCADALQPDVLTIFDTAQDWISHVADMHFKTLAPNRLQELSKLSMRTMVQPMKCPLCEFTVDTVLPEIHSHITEHVHAFALRALPCGVTGDMNFAESGANDADADSDRDLDIESDDGQELDLRSRILNALVQTPQGPLGSSNSFLPNGQLSRLVDAVSVAHELTSSLSQSHTAEKIQEIADVVCMETPLDVRGPGEPQPKSYRKIFAILVLTEMSSSIADLIAYDVSDIDLPLKATFAGRNEFTLQRKATSDESLSGPLECFDKPGWSLEKRSVFEGYQWALLAPIFSPESNGGVNHYSFLPRHILPFESVFDNEQDFEHTGAFSKVSLVHIHKDHAKFTASDRGFAIKRLYGNNQSKFSDEVRVLGMFSGANAHPHVINLLATYERSDDFHLMFYRAGGDLHKFWMEIEPVPKLTYKNILWVAEQCLGIADGLSKLHAGSVRGLTVGNIEQSAHADSDDTESRMYGLHGDISPDNILWFGDNPKTAGEFRGSLQIAGFGLAELTSRRDIFTRRDVVLTPTYYPPKCDVEPEIVGQSFDIWCLACVYLEFCAWALGGSQLLSEFVERRIFHDESGFELDTFFQIVNSDLDQKGAIVKPAIIEVGHFCYVHRTCITQ